MIPTDTRPRLDDKCTKKVQHIVGSLLYYARAIDLTILMALSTIVREQVKSTEKTEKVVQKLLDYGAMYPDAKVRYYARNMILNIYSDASYTSLFLRTATARWRRNLHQRGNIHPL